MTRDWRNFPRWFLLTAVLFCPVAAWMVSGSMAGKNQVLEGPDYQQARLDFSGQTAVLTGMVRSASALQNAVTLASTQIRIGPRWWNGALNPVARVRNELRLAAPGFVMLARLGNQGLVAGQTFDEREQDRVIAAASPLLPERKDTLLLTVASERGEAPNLGDTLKSFPAEVNPETPTLLAATLGQPLERIDPKQSDDALQALFSGRGWDWNLCEPLVLQLREWISNAAEAKRRMALPPPHLLLLAAGEHVYLKGTVAEEATQRALVEAAGKHFAGRSVVSEITVSEDRRPTIDLHETVSALPPAPGPKTPGLTAFAIPGQPWLVHEIKPGEEFATISLIPESFPLELAKADFESLATLHAGHLQALVDLAAQEGWPQSFLLLLISGSNIELRGEVPTESLKKAVIAAADQAYAPHPVTENVRLNAERSPVTVAQAAKVLESWPTLPSESSSGLIAFTLLASPWTQAEVPPVQLRSEEMDEFARLKLLPPSMKTEDVREDLTAFASVIAEHSQRLRKITINRMPPRPYLAMLALGRQVILRGDAGSRELKEKVAAAARTFYKGREVIDELRIQSDPPVIIKPGFTVKTFPPAPAVDGPGLLGFNLPGQPWLQVPLTWEIPTRETLENAGLFSKMFDASQAWPDYESWLPQLSTRAKPSPTPTKPP